jgi:organic radical activating enzyme
LVYLVEHFYSIQGEGKFVGVPSVFFRFGGCNLKCEGFACSEVAPNGTKVLGCDTVYAVNKEHFLQNWFPVSDANELLNILDLYDLPRKVDIVLTGGEPLLYSQDEVFISFLQALHVRGHRICFETNAIVDIDFEKFPIYKECYFALSVKLSNSNEPYKKRVKPDTIFNLATNSKDAFFKFVIDADSIDLGLEEEIENIIMHSPKTDIYCMPMGSNKEDLEKNSLSLVEFCKAKGYCFSDRLHIRIWNQEKGV